MRYSRGWALPAFIPTGRIPEELLNETLLMSLNHARVVIAD
jgi:hypothetical protein